MSDRDKDTEILALRHQIAVLERWLGKQKARFTPSSAFLATLPAPAAAAGGASAAAAGTPGHDPWVGTAT